MTETLEHRIQQFEEKGMPTSDAQAAVEAEDYLAAKAAAKLNN
jgi:hypothetical protein